MTIRQSRRWAWFVAAALGVVALAAGLRLTGSFNQPSAPQGPIFELESNLATPAGNAVLLVANGTRVLVDAGMSAREIAKRMASLGEDPASLDGILLTHEHGDHVCGLEVLCRKLDVPIYANSQTAGAVRYDCA